MGQHVSYQKNCLGQIRTNDNGTNKDVFVAESLDSLITLLRLDPTDPVELSFVVGRDSAGKITCSENVEMPFEQYRKEYLSKVSAFYPTFESWLLKNYAARTSAEFESIQAGRKS